MSQTKYCARLKKVSRATIEEAELFLSSMLAICEEVNQPSPPSVIKSCSCSTTVQFSKVEEPQVLQEIPDDPPLPYVLVSTRCEGPRYANKVLNTAGSAKNKKSYKKENIRYSSPKTRTARVGSKSRRIYASPFRARRSGTNMSESERLKVLEKDELVGEIKPASVWCLGCEAWVALDKRRRYYTGMWEKHKNHYHLPNGPQYQRAQKIYMETGQRARLFEPKRRDD